MKRTKDDIMSDFMDLSCALSPENLHCDGEASPQQVKNSLANINKAWTQLETEIGYSVTEDDVWKYDREQKKQKASEVTPPAVIDKEVLVADSTTTPKKKNFFGI